MIIVLKKRKRNWLKMYPFQSIFLLSDSVSGANQGDPQVHKEGKYDACIRTNDLALNRYPTIPSNPLFPNPGSTSGCSAELEIRRFSARNWPIMRWIVYGYLVIVMQ